MIPCEVVTTFETYEECAQYMMKNEVNVLRKLFFMQTLSKFLSFQAQSEESQEKRSYPFEKYFVKILREHPVLYDEKHRKFGREFPTKHAWSIVAGYMMMKSK